MAKVTFNIKVVIEDSNPGAALLSDASSKLEFPLQDAIGNVLDADEAVETWAIYCQRRIS